MKGYRTIVVNVVAILAAIAAGYGLEISPEDQNSIGLGVLALTNIVLRLVTTTAVGKQE